MAEILNEVEEESIPQRALRHGFRIDITADKGRVCVAASPFEVGSVIFTEEAFVFASELDDRCFYCARGCEAGMCPRRQHQQLGREPHPIEGTEELDELVGSLAEIKGVWTEDRARCWIKCMLMAAGDESKVKPLLELTAANLGRCMRAAEEAHKLCPALFPPINTEAARKAATILSVLNTNSHELEQLEGSGLFLLACTMEHDCRPNCSFTTYGDSIWLTAIRPVEAGDHLSIDYGNNFYRPTAERLEDLEATYDFRCSCGSCTRLPDRCRAFKHSPGCGGVVSPCGLGQSNSDWRCLACGQQLTAEERAACEEAERVLNDLLERGSEEENIVGVEGVDALLERPELVSLHPSHHLLYWLLRGLADVLGQDPASFEDGRMEAIYQRVIAMMEEVVEGHHHEKVIIFDRLAQSRIVAGKVAAAADAWQRAYAMSRIVSGAETEPTLGIGRLAEKPPQSVQEMQARYAASKA